MREFAARVTLSGLSGALASGATAAVAGHGARPLNAIAHIYDGGPPRGSDGPAYRNTAIGVALHTGASIGWATFFEALRPALRAPGAAAVTAGMAYVVDYYVVSRRFQPGFERFLGPRGMLAVYAALAAGFVAAATLGRAEGRPSGRSRPRGRPTRGPARR